MKRITTTVFLVISINSFSQNNNSYTTYIQHDTAIHWAAECDKVINLTSKVQSHSLKKWYLVKLKNGVVSAYKINNTRDAVSSYHLSIPGIEKQEWLKGLSIELPPYKNPKEWFFYDKTIPKENYERYKYRVGTLRFSADSCCGCDDADAFRAKQILDYKNGKFSIYNVFISPLCARQTGVTPIEWFPLCNVAYTDNAERKFPKLSKDVVLLNTDEVEYEFTKETASPFDSVLTIDRTDIGSLIYKDVINDIIKPVEIESGKPIPAKKFLIWNMPVDTIPAYNDNNEVTGYRVVQQARNSKEFSRFRIKQDFYFDFKNEKLYSVIRSVVIILPVRLYDGTIRGYAQYCRIY